MTRNRVQAQNYAKAMAAGGVHQRLTRRCTLQVFADGSADVDTASLSFRALRQLSQKKRQKAWDRVTSALPQDALARLAWARQVPTRFPMGGKEDWGPVMWAALHLRAVSHLLSSAPPIDPQQEKNWVNLWLGAMPCGPCGEELAPFLASHPADFSSPEAYFRWGVDMHNHINGGKAAKPAMSAQAAREYWMSQLLAEARTSI